MDTLVVEALAWSPHLETAGELALRRRDDGFETGFCFLDVPNPDDSLPARSLLVRSGLLDRRHKVHRLEEILERAGVQVLHAAPIQGDAARRIQQFVANAPTALDALREYRYGAAHLGAGVVASLVACTSHSRPDPREHVDVVQRYLFLAAACFEMTRALLDAARPSRVLTFNGRFAGALAIAEAARLRAIPIQFHERGATMHRFEVFDEPPQQPAFIQREVARYWAAGGANRGELGAEFFRRRRAGHGVGWLPYVTRQEKGVLPPLRAGARTLVYFSSSDDETEFIDQGATPSLFASPRHAVQHLVEWVHGQENSLLVIRVHPNLARAHPDDRAWWESLAGANVCLVPAGSSVDTYALIDAADLVLSSGSTTGVEATFWGRPSIALAESYFSGEGCVYEPRTLPELHALLERSDLPALPRERCLPYGYHSAVFGTPFKYYAPESLFIGTFMGRELGYEAKLLGLGRVARAIRRFLRGRTAAEGAIAA